MVAILVPSIRLVFIQIQDILRGNTQYTYTKVRSILISVILGYAYRVRVVSAIPVIGMS